MKKCSFCGADLPQDARFCGKCGNLQDASATGAAATVSNTLQPPSWAPDGGTIAASWSPFTSYPAQGSGPAWTPNVQDPVTPPPVAEDEDERRRGIPPWSPLYGAALGGEALLGSGPVSSPGVPFVPGTPQIGSVPALPGTPNPYANAPASLPMQGAGNAAPVSHPMQGSAHMPVGHPVQGPGNIAPVNHPVQGPAQLPVSHPVQWPQPVHPVHQPPEQPGVHEHHPIHKRHRHHDHDEQHEPERHHSHHTQHVHRTATHVSKVAGGSSIKTILVVVATVVVVATGGIVAAAHFLGHPQPLISISSSYMVGNTPAGATGTVLHINGQQFSGNSAITFLLDGQSAPGNPGTHSDANGNFSADVTITSAWSVGTHTLTARDASNNSTQNGVSVTIVQQGQANTPGPNGAPPDDASFRLKVTIQVADPYIGQPFASNPVLIITGHPDPEGGTVCSPDDNGQPFTYNGTTYNNGTPYTETDTASCSGTYKAGQINYIETDTGAKSSWQSNGVSVNCVLNNPAVVLQLAGTYAGNNTFSGKINYPNVPYTCDQQGYQYYQEALTGTWTGTIVAQ